jgi:SH3 domain protein
MDANTSRIAIGLLLYLIISLGHADSVYVNDSLRVGVRTEPSNSVAPIGVVTTGMQLEVIQRQDDYVKIRTEQGLEGWIKNSYVVPEPPAMIKLQQLQKEYDDLRARVGKHADLIKTTETTNKSLSEQIQSLQSENSQLQQALLEEQQRNRESVGTYLWPILSYLLICVVGVLIGVIWHRRQAMKRLGGLRV